jgi:AAA+ superfamily predicted ATPase
MAKADQIKALIESHAQRDDTRFYAVAMQVAAQAARNGHGRLAVELRQLVDEAKVRSTRPRVGAAPTPIARPRGELAGLISAAYPKTLLTEMALEPNLAERLERVLREQRSRDEIRSHGFAPLRKLLLVGPPGTGKSMTAAALAGELSVPLFSIRLDGLITKFMGETAAKLRLVFDAIESTRGVYLFDEFDALGAARETPNDVGEIRRVLGSFLQFLEQDDSDSLIVCATNHRQLLDAALFRRFDSVLEYVSPTREVAVKIMRSRLAIFDTGAVDWDVVAAGSEGLSHAEITHACEQAAKHSILAGTRSVDTKILGAALLDRHSTGL